MKPGEDVDVTFVVDEKFSDARLTFARSNVQRRQTILHKIYVGPYTPTLVSYTELTQRTPKKIIILYIVCII